MLRKFKISIDGTQYMVEMEESRIVAMSFCEPRSCSP